MNDYRIAPKASTNFNYKCKIFCDKDHSALETIFNKWLSDNTSLSICDIKYQTSTISYHYVVYSILVFYQDTQ